MTTRTRELEIAQVGVILHLINEARIGARSWSLRFDYPRHPSGSGINVGDEDPKAQNWTMTQNPDGAQVLIWHAADEDDLLVPGIPRRISLGAQLRGISSVTVPFLLAAAKMESKSGRVKIRRDEQTVSCSIDWDAD